MICLPHFFFVKLSILYQILVDFFSEFVVYSPGSTLTAWEVLVESSTRGGREAAGGSLRGALEGGQMSR